MKRKRGGGGRRNTDDVRGSEVLCLRHGGCLREAGEDSQHGSVLSQETLVHPPQGLDLSQSGESLHRGGERYREGQTEKACREAGRVQRGRLIQRQCTYSLTHTDREGKNNRSDGLISKTYINEYLHNRGDFEKKWQKLQQAKEASSLWV